jgi:hypothetical protein
MQIHGKEYAEVKDRIAEYRKSHPDWSIETVLLKHADDMSWVLFLSILHNKDKSQAFTGHAYEERTEDTKQVNFTSWVENCETSAVGRALANMDLRLSDQRPSAEEMGKVERMTTAPATVTRLKLHRAGEAKEPTEADRLKQGIMSAKGSIVALMGHDRSFQQALSNRGIKDLSEVKTVSSLSELFDSLSNYVQYVDDRLVELGVKSAKDLSAKDREALDESLIKMELLL